MTGPQLLATAAVVRRIRRSAKYDVADFEIVLTTRCVDPQAGLLALPSTALFVGETSSAAAIRCVQEHCLLQGLIAEGLVFFSPQRKGGNKGSRENEKQTS